MVSDPVDFDLAPLSDLAVTIRVKDPTDAITGHPGARCTSYLQAGDAVAEPDLPRAARTPHWYYLCGVDVDAPDVEAAAVAVLGDSITDGRGSPTDGNGRWTDHLARRLHEGEGTARVGVLNQGLGGNRLLNDGLGPNALARLDRDVLAQPGVRWLIVLEGINDLGTRSATARDVIGAYEQIIRRAHARGIKVVRRDDPALRGLVLLQPRPRSRTPGGQRLGARLGPLRRGHRFRRGDPRPPEALAPLCRGGRRRPPAPGPEGYKIMAARSTWSCFKNNAPRHDVEIANVLGMTDGFRSVSPPERRNSRSHRHRRALRFRVYCTVGIKPNFSGARHGDCTGAHDRPSVCPGMEGCARGNTSAPGSSGARTSISS